MRFGFGKANSGYMARILSIVVFLSAVIAWDPSYSAVPALKKNVLATGAGMVGADRSYFYYVSSKINRSGFNPVIIALHDNGQTVEQFAEQSGWIKVAEENGLVVVFPEPANKTWSPYSGDENAYLKSVYDHVSTHLTAGEAEAQPPPRAEESRPVAAPGIAGDEPVGAFRRPAVNRINTWQPWQYITGVGAGAVAAQEFTMANPGLIAAIATLDGTAYRAAYEKGAEKAQGYLENQRGGKTATPVWRPLKKDVPVPAWLFTTGDPGSEEIKIAEYWKHSDAVNSSPATRTIQGFQAKIYRNTNSPVQQVRVTALPATATYNEALASAIWNDFFSHIARWTDSPNGTVGPMMTEAEVNRTFDVKEESVDGKIYKYYVKTPSSYRKGKPLPLVISLHGGLFPAWMYLSQIKMHEVGEKEGFVTVYLNGQGNMWNFTVPNSPDVDAIQKLIDEMVENYGVDRSRIYMQGFSFGSGMTHVEGLLHPQLFAAISPDSGIGDLTQPVLSAIANAKAQQDLRLPTLIVYGSVDAGGSTDGKIPAEGVLRNAIDYLKKFNHISTPDQISRYDSPNTKSYDVLTPGGRLTVTGADGHYPGGRFLTYDYTSSDPVAPLLSFVWVTDMPHGNDSRQAQMVWDYFKHWKRNTDGSLSYLAK